MAVLEVLNRCLTIFVCVWEGGALYYIRCGVEFDVNCGVRSNVGGLCGFHVGSSALNMCFFLCVVPQL